MKITEVHDWAQVFADGKLLARLDRRRGEFALQLPVLKKGTRIDILIEAMGRVNFDESIHDRKGITEKVELVRGKQSAELKNWTDCINGYENRIKDIKMGQLRLCLRIIGLPSVWIKLAIRSLT